MDVGFIGLGSMGLAMAGRPHAAEYRLTVSREAVVSMLTDELDWAVLARLSAHNAGLSAPAPWPGVMRRCAESR